MNKVLIAAAAMGFVTLLTRAFPFLLFSKKHPPERFLKGARLIPGAVMTVLVLTSLPLKTGVTDPAVIIPWAAGLSVVIFHFLWKNALLSIFGGTAFYMALLYFFT